MFGIHNKKRVFFVREGRSWKPVASVRDEHRTGAYHPLLRYTLHGTWPLMDRDEKPVVKSLYHRGKEYTTLAALEKDEYISDVTDYDSTNLYYDETYTLEKASEQELAEMASGSEPSIFGPGYDAEAEHELYKPDGWGYRKTKEEWEDMQRRTSRGAHSPNKKRARAIPLRKKPRTSARRSRTTARGER